MSLPYAFALNANTAAVTDANGRVTSAVPGAAGTVLTANTGAEPTFQPLSLPSGASIINPQISGTSTTMSGLSASSGAPYYVLTEDGSSHVQIIGTTGGNAGGSLAVLNQSPTINTPNLSGSTTTLSGTSASNGAPFFVVVLDGSNTTQHLGTTGGNAGGSLAVLNQSPSIVTPTLSGTTSKVTGATTNATPTAYLTLDGSNNICQTIRPIPNLVQPFVTPGVSFTYTPTAGTKYIFLEMVGGGGGGGAAGSGGAVPGGGGGAGCYASFFLVINPAKTYGGVIAAQAASATLGGDTSFGETTIGNVWTLVLHGGDPGTNTGIGGAGGTGTFTGSGSGQPTPLKLIGGGAGSCQISTLLGGPGATGPWGGGVGITTLSSNGVSAKNYTGGGGGGASNGAGLVGGTGSTGNMYISEYFY